MWFREHITDNRALFLCQHDSTVFFFLWQWEKKNPRKCEQGNERIMIKNDWLTNLKSKEHFGHVRWFIFASLYYFFLKHIAMTSLCSYPGQYHLARVWQTQDALWRMAEILKVHREICRSASAHFASASGMTSQGHSLIPQLVQGRIFDNGFVMACVYRIPCPIPLWVVSLRCRQTLKSMKWRRRSTASVSERLKFAAVHVSDLAYDRNEGWGTFLLYYLANWIFVALINSAFQTTTVPYLKLYFFDRLIDFFLCVFVCASKQTWHWCWRGTNTSWIRSPPCPPWWSTSRPVLNLIVTKVTNLLSNLTRMLRNSPRTAISMEVSHCNVNSKRKGKKSC